jgi:5'-3' exonuclease
MGIKNLHNLLRKICPRVYNTVPLTKYAFKKIAIDLSLFMCKYKTSYGAYWLDGFLQMITVLRHNDIHFVIVYDSKAPPEKDNERKQRSEARAKSRLRVDKLQEAWEEYRKTHDDKDVVLLEEFKEQDEVLYTFLQKFMDGHEEGVSPSKIGNELERMQQSLLSIKAEDFELTKELFAICGVPIHIATGEAERSCSALNCQGFVSAVLTDDTDVLAYSAPTMLCKIDFQTNTCIELDYQEILSELKLTSAEFLDLCIMCGTDYNTNLPKVGCDKSFKLIQQYRTLENIEEAFPHFNYDVLNYRRVRELFLDPLVFEPNTVPFCDFPDQSRLFEFCFTHNCRTDLNTVIKACCTSQFHEFEFDSEQDQKQENKKNLLLFHK